MCFKTIFNSAAYSEHVNWIQWKITHIAQIFLSVLVHIHKGADFQLENDKFVTKSSKLRHV